MSEIKKKTILFSPLGWGLGHASRIIPLISKEQEPGNNVIVAADKSSIALVKSIFPNITTIPFKSINVRFCKKNNQLLPLFWFALRIPFVRIREHRKLQQIIKEYKVDMVISDNRYGLYSKRAFCVIITHQLRIIPPKPFGFTSKLIGILLKRWLKRFNEVWVPDYPQENSIAGELSRSNGLPNIKYIGLLSRFKLITPNTSDRYWELVGIVSGPEPHRTIFEEKLTQLGQKFKLKTLILKGIPNQGNEIIQESEYVWKAGHLQDIEFYSAIKNARYIVARSGYSTIMDLLTIGKSGLLVPTPGQTEQEYLAKHLAEKGFFKSVKQDSILNITLAEL
ncbi:MAG: hypothetical protein PWR03_521 [Tenuifilum sp.]|jgi:uncharacterized protein (TIGR00661 family)|uniref:glycosyltransferase n=1 Tax=Tenuifilum sp. TaxID=2760880 RepID=UPI0024ABBF7A|nr:glycosyltransferase [Tenuifilum sp.]MDI3526338.1 hypothetical protein [Tenuifilum sp.]